MRQNTMHSFGSLFSQMQAQISHKTCINMYWDVDSSFSELATSDLSQYIPLMLIIRPQEKNLRLLVLGFQPENLN